RWAARHRATLYADPVALHELCRIKCRCFFRHHIKHRERNASLLRGSSQRPNIDRRIESQQSIFRPKSVVERAAIVEPKMRNATPGHCRRGKAPKCVGRMYATIVSDQWRTVVEVTKVQAGRRELLGI